MDPKTKVSVETVGQPDPEVPPPRRGKHISHLPTGTALHGLGGRSRPRRVSGWACVWTGGEGSTAPGNALRDTVNVPCPQGGSRVPRAEVPRPCVTTAGDLALCGRALPPPLLTRGGFCPRDLLLEFPVPLYAEDLVPLDPAHTGHRPASATGACGLWLPAPTRRFTPTRSVEGVGRVTGKTEDSRGPDQTASY